MKTKFKKLLQQQFVKHFITLFTGTIISQLILFGITPILTRIYTESFFGILTFYTSLITVLKILVSLRYEITLILPKRDKDAINLLIINIIVITFLSFIILIVTILLKNSINKLLAENSLKNYIYLISPGVFSLGLIDAFTYWNNRFKKYDNISYTRISKSVAVSGAQLIVGFSKLNFIGMIPGMLFGQFVALIHLFLVSFKEIIKLWKFVSLKRMLFQLKKYKDIPIYNTMLSFSNTVSSQLPGILLPNLYGLIPTGYYGMSSRIVGTPFGLIGQSVAQIFYKKSADIINTNIVEFYPFIKKTYKNLFAIGLLISIFVFLTTFLFEYFLGKNWAETGLYSRILLPFLFIGFLNSPVSSIINTLNRQKTMVIYDLLLLIARFIAIYLGYYFSHDILVSLILFSFVGVCFNIFLTNWFLKIARETYMSSV